MGNDENENEKKFEDFRDKLERCVGRDEYLLATVLLACAKERIGRPSVERRPWEDPEKSRDNMFREVKYEIMQRANDMRMVSPFHDDDKLRDLFDEAMKLDELDWDRAFDIEAEEEFVSRMPQALMDLYRSHIGAETKSVLIVEAEKFYPYLKDIIDNNKDKRFVLTTQNDLNRIALQFALGELDKLGNVEIITADVYGVAFTKQKVNLIFALPSGRGGSMSGANMMIAAMNNLLCNLDEGARLVVTIPGRTIGSMRDDWLEVRGKISKDNRLIEMAELPGGLFDYTALKTCFLDVERADSAEDDAVTVRRYALKGVRRVADESVGLRRAGWRSRRASRVAEIEIDGEVSVKARDLWDAEEWNIPRMLSSKDDVYRAFCDSSVPKVRLETVATVVRGWANYERGSDGNVGVLSISNLAEDGIDLKDLDRIQADDDRRLASYRLNDGDLLLTARGTAPKTAVFRDPGFPCVASVNLIVIRPKDNPADKNGQELPRLNPVYLKIFLDSKLGKSLLRGLQQGDRLINLSHRDLEKLEIPLPSKEEQDEKAIEYEKEYEIYRKAANRWDRAKEGLQKF